MRRYSTLNLCVALCFTVSFECGKASKSLSANDDDKVEIVNLVDLSNRELERICTSRGFELIRDADPETGKKEKWEHDDYVEAANQCLDVEREMKRKLRENPNLVQDLQKERKRMEAEVERLEKKLLSAKSGKREKLSATDTTESENDNRLSWFSSSKTKKTASDEGKKIQPVESQPECASATTYSSAGTSIINIQETLADARARMVQDLKTVMQVLFPPPIRDPVVEIIVKPLIRIAKNLGAGAIDLVKRYVMVAMNWEEAIKRKQMKNR